MVESEMESATKCTHIPYLPLSFNVFKLECLSKMIPRLKHGTKLLLNTCGVRRKLTSGAGAFKSGFHPYRTIIGIQI
jgi:hypothetical protein